MALSEQAKREAMSAVREARPYLADMRSASHADLEPRHYDYPAAPTHSMESMPDAKKRRAMSAVKEAAPHIEMLRETGTVEVMAQRFPANDNRAHQTADRIARMEKSGYDANAIGQSLTKDDFARE